MSNFSSLNNENTLTFLERLIADRHLNKNNPKIIDDYETMKNFERNFEKHSVLFQELTEPLYNFNEKNEIYDHNTVGSYILSCFNESNHNSGINSECNLNCINYGLKKIEDKVCKKMIFIKDGNNIVQINQVSNNDAIFYLKNNETYNIDMFNKQFNGNHVTIVKISEEGIYNVIWSGEVINNHNNTMVIIFVVIIIVVILLIYFSKNKVKYFRKI